MSFSWMRFRTGAMAVAMLLVLGWVTGCETPPPPPELGASGGQLLQGAANTSDRLRPNDLVTIVFSGVSNPPEKYVGQIKEDGNINLPYIGSVEASGKTTAELEKIIHDLYVPKYYVHLSVNVNSENRFIYVLGEVRTPSRQLHAGQMTVLRAIASAGGFTDFARKTKVQLIRANGQVIYVNCERAKDNPQLDLPVYAGDRVYVMRRRI